VIKAEFIIITPVFLVSHDPSQIINYLLLSMLNYHYVDYFHYIVFLCHNLDFFYSSYDILSYNLDFLSNNLVLSCQSLGFLVIIMTLEIIIPFCVNIF